MSTPYSLYTKNELPLYDEVVNNNNTNYSVYRCFNNSKTTGPPWFPDKNLCPCDPNTNNVTGRGYTLCSFGVVEKEKIYGPASDMFHSNQIPSNNKIVGNLFNDSQTVPPQLDPNPFVRIGQGWRTVE